VRVNIVSDVHGATSALARAGEGADVLFCLGDLVLFLDYHDSSQGIFAELFGSAQATEYIRLRTARRFAEASELSHRLWAQAGDRLGQDRAEIVAQKVRGQYRELFAAMPVPAYLTYGNVDLPGYWADYLRPGQQVLDGESVELGGLRFGFVGGGLRSPMRTPYELDEQTYAAKVAALGPVDVLCSHIPPSLPGLTYDVQARRFEVGSRALLEYVRDVQPRMALFGHVHQPLARRCRVGRTECVNVGHFRGTGTPFTLSW
jgi:Icc-related predicted phosphoesterase